MSASFLVPGEAPPEPRRKPNRRWFLLLPAALSGAFLAHWLLAGPPVPVPRPGPRRFPKRR